MGNGAAAQCPGRRLINCCWRDGKLCCVAAECAQMLAEFNISNALLLRKSTYKPMSTIRWPRLSRGVLPSAEARYVCASTASEAEMAGLSTRAWKLGVRARLLLAFFGITGFAVLAAVAGIYAVGQVGARLERIDARVPPTLTSLELSRSAERIIAAAPALLAATDRQRQEEVKAQLAAEVTYLNATVRDLKSDRTGVQPLLEIEPFVSSLTTNIVALENAVARRLAMSESVATLRREVFRANAETQRLLAPTLMVMDSQIATLVEAVQKTGADDGGRTVRQLASLIERRGPNETAKDEFAPATDMRVEALTADQDRRLPVLIFQLGRALRDLDATAVRLDPKLRPLFEDQVAKLRELVDGPNAIAVARKEELVLISEGQKLLAENAGLSAQLIAAVDRLAGTAKRDIDEATRGALSVQRLSTRVLVALVALSLLTSALIAWLYVGRNIVRRLTVLNDGMLAIAGGKLDTPVVAKGADEIAAMGQAVEIFRKNTLERNELLVERAQAAERLERQVEERTAELTDSLEYQTATSGVLDVISRSPTDVQPVFDAIAESAARLCKAQFCHVFRFDGEFIHFEASHGLRAEGVEAIRGHYPMAPGPGSAAARSIVSRTVAEISDVFADPDYRQGEIARIVNYRSIVAVPMLKEGRPIGTIALAQSLSGPFPETQIALLKTFADQAVIAIENVRLFDEAQARSRELAQSVAELRALGEVSKAVNSTINLENVLSTIVAKAVQLSGAEAGTIYVFDEASQEFQLRSTYGMNEAQIAEIKGSPIRRGD